MPKKLVKDFLYGKDSYQIRGACFDIWQAFKGIFKEKVIDNALRKELESRGLNVESQNKIKIYYKGEKVGVYVPDLIVNDRILIEIKVKPFLTKEDEKQFWLYLQGSQYKLGFLINFGTKKLEIKRRIYDKAREKYFSASNQRSNQRFKSASTNKGFTLVEMLVVLSVIAILSSISLAYYREGEKSVSLSRSAQKLAQDLSNAKEMALTGQKFNSVFPNGGYGIYFVQNSESYILFADSDGDKEYDEVERVETLSLEKNAKISFLSPSSPLTITFFPPDPTVTIIPVAVSAIITISLNNKTKTITVNSVGSIDID